MVAFHVLFPEEARDECRTVTPFNDRVLPSRTFLFVEAYCVQPHCDCRRVMITVIDPERSEQVATINHAFEPPRPPFMEEGQTFLDPLNPQSSLSEGFLELFERMIANDAAYAARLERHYRMWKRVVNDPSHPAQDKLCKRKPGFGILGSLEPFRRERAKVGPNEPCPCGSGKKFKRCCGK